MKELYKQWGKMLAAVVISLVAIADIAVAVWQRQWWVAIGLFLVLVCVGLLYITKKGVRLLIILGLLAVATGVSVAFVQNVPWTETETVPGPSQVVVVPGPTTYITVPPTSGDGRGKTSEKSKAPSTQKTKGTPTSEASKSASASSQPTVNGSKSAEASPPPGEATESAAPSPAETGTTPTPGASPSVTSSGTPSAPVASTSSSAPQPNAEASATASGTSATSASPTG